MPDNPKGPEQNLIPDAQPDQGQGASAPKALTREDMIELLTEHRNEVKKQYDGLRSMSDKRFNELQQRFHQAQQQTVHQPDYPEEEAQQPVGYDYGTESDQLLAEAAVRGRYADFDADAVGQVLNDPAVNGQFARLKEDGRTVDWVATKMAAHKYLREKRADEILAKQAEAEQKAEAERAEQKRQAVISGSQANYPEGVKIPQTKEEARNLSDSELAEALVAEFDIPGEEMPEFVKENLNKG